MPKTILSKTIRSKTIIPSHRRLKTPFQKLTTPSVALMAVSKKLGIDVGPGSVDRNAKSYMAKKGIRFVGGRKTRRKRKAKRRRKSRRKKSRKTLRKRKTKRRRRKR